MEINFSGESTSEKLKPHDPSTIFTNLPVARPNGDVDEPGGYQPDYKCLTPHQRWKYLNWLSNITDQISFDYVFIYYVGLERQLFFGDFEKAFDEILLLKKYHSGKSFDSYSDSALLNACIYRRKLDKLREIKGGIKNMQIAVLIASCKFKEELSIKQTIQVFNKTRKINRKYMNENYKLFVNVLPNILKQEFSTYEFPLYKIVDYNNISNRLYMQFSNSSLPDKFSRIYLPSILFNAEIELVIQELYKKACQQCKKISKTFKST